MRDTNDSMPRYAALGIPRFATLRGATPVDACLSSALDDSVQRRSIAWHRPTLRGTARLSLPLTRCSLGAPCCSQLEGRGLVFASCRSLRPLPATAAVHKGLEGDACTCGGLVLWYECSDRICSQVDVMMGTFTKSFGSAGGYVAASKEVAGSKQW